MQQQPKLVGYEPMAAQAVGFHMELEVLDPVLALAALSVELVELLGGIWPGANHETPVRSLLHRFGDRGELIAAVYLQTGSLLLPVLLHAVIDLRFLLVPARALPAGQTA